MKIPRFRKQQYFRIKMDQREQVGTLWRKCPSCKELVFRERVQENRGICPRCGGYFPLTAPERLALLADEGSFEDISKPIMAADPLGFVDRKPYPERLREAQEETGLPSEVLVGRARLGGLPIVLAVMDFRFIGGSMGSVMGEQLAHAIGLAAREGRPFILVSSSGGARMQEGTLSLMQMAKTAAARRELEEAKVPFISVMVYPTTGGVLASLASLGDVILAEKGALIGFAGRRVIEQTTGEKLPPDFQTEKFAYEHGMVDRVVGREEMKAELGRILSFFIPDSSASAPAARVQSSSGSGDSPSTSAPASEAELDPWERVQLARHPQRPTTLDYIELLMDDFYELHGDRLSSDDKAIVGGLAKFAGRTVVVVGHQKGRDPEEGRARRWGMPGPEGYRKALRLMRLAERFGFPIISFIDTPGAYPGREAEERNIGGAIAESIYGMLQLRTPIVVAIIGEGGSGGAIALGVGDRVLMLENAYYSVISPEGCAAILWRDRGKAPEAAAALKLTAADLLELGVIDELVEEPPGGAHTAPEEAAQSLRAALLRHLGELEALPPGELIRRRCEKFKGMGIWEERPPESAQEDEREGSHVSDRPGR